MQQSISQKIILQRYYSLLLNSMGELLKINFISGDIIEGLLHSIDPINNEYFIINNPRRLSRTGVPIFLKESMLKIYFKEISYINFELKNSLKFLKNNFETDIEVSKKNLKKEKEEEKLVKYEINEEDKNIFTYKGLEDDINDKKEEKWDQFEINKKKYNVISTYDENLYTTKLDKSKITKEQNDYAEKICNEIKNSNNNEKNIHILEDRGIIEERDGDFDEEEKYSSVIKNNNINVNRNKIDEIQKMSIQNCLDNKGNIRSNNNLNNLNRFNLNNNNILYNNNYMNINFYNTNNKLNVNYYNTNNNNYIFNNVYNNFNNFNNNNISNNFCNNNNLNGNNKNI